MLHEEDEAATDLHDDVADDEEDDEEDDDSQPEELPSLEQMTSSTNWSAGSSEPDTLYQPNIHELKSLRLNQTEAPHDDQRLHMQVENTEVTLTTPLPTDDTSLLSLNSTTSDLSWTQHDQ